MPFCFATQWGKILLSLSVFRLLRFCCSCLSNLTVSPHPVRLLAGVLAAAPAKLFLEPSSSSTPLLQLQSVVSSLRASKAHGCRPSGKEGHGKREVGWGGGVGGLERVKK